MEEKNFWSYFLNRLVIIGTLVPFIAWVISYFRTNSFQVSLIWFLGVTVLLLMYLLYEKFIEFKKREKLYANLVLENQKILSREKELNENFDKQSLQYTENIQELNQHKQITMVVSTLVEGSSPETKEGKQLINLLRVGLEKVVKESDNNEI